MNIDELVVDLREQRAHQVRVVEEGRKLRVEANNQIKAASHELLRIDRLLRAAEGRTRKEKVIRDGASQ